MSELENPLIIFSLRRLGVLKRFTNLTDIRVLVAALENVGHDNIIFGTQTAMAVELDLHSLSVSRSFKNLCDWGIFLKSRENGVTLYRLNPDFGVKGQTRKDSPNKQKKKKPSQPVG